MWRKISKVMIAGLLFTSLVGCSSSNGETAEGKKQIIIRKVILPLLLHQGRGWLGFNSSCSSKNNE